LNKRNKKMLSNALLALLAAVLVWLIIKRVNLGNAIDALYSTSPGWLLTSGIVMLGSHFLRGYRWKYLVEPLGYTMNPRRSFYAVLTGYLVNVGTSRGGEVVRCALLARSERIPFETLVGTVVTERVVDLFMLVFTFLAALLFEFTHIYGYVLNNVWEPLYAAIGWKGIALMVLLGLAVLAILVLWRVRVQRRQKAAKAEGFLQRFAIGVKSIFELKKPWIFLILSMGIWVGYALSAWCLMKALPGTAHLWITAGLSIVIFSAIGISIPAPAGLGVVFPIAHGIQEVYKVPGNVADNYALLNLAFSNLLMIGSGLVAYGLLWWEMQKMNGDETG
jgi:glycosyltransferase 2 family protein